MFKRTVGQLEVKKVIDRFEEQQENIPPIQENEQQIQEHEEQQVENDEQEEEGILQEPLQEIIMHDHSWFADLLGLISLHKGIIFQTIFC